MNEVKLADRDMAQFGLGLSKVVPREKIITYLGQTDGYLHGSAMIQIVGRSRCMYTACIIHLLILIL